MSLHIGNFFCINRNVINGYYTEENGQGVRLTDSKGQSLSAYDFDKDISVYPYYTFNTYHITYNSDGGSLEGEGTYTYDFTIETDDIILPSLIKSGYKFDGWYLNSDFSGSKITTITKGTHEDITLQINI